MLESSPTFFLMLVPHYIFHFYLFCFIIFLIFFLYVHFYIASTFFPPSYAGSPFTFNIRACQSFHWNSFQFAEQNWPQKSELQYRDVQAILWRKNLWNWTNPWLKFWQKKFLDGLNPGQRESSLRFAQEVSFRRRHLPLNFHLRVGSHPQSWNTKD